MKHIYTLTWTQMQWQIVLHVTWNLEGKIEAWSWTDLLTGIFYIPNWKNWEGITKV